MLNQTSMRVSAGDAKRGRFKLVSRFMLNQTSMRVSAGDAKRGRFKLVSRVGAIRNTVNLFFTC